MTDRQLSIALVARDAASGVVAGVGRSLGVLSTTARAATVSMGAIGTATVVANQGLELLKKGAELARGAYELFIAKAMEARDATDPGKMALTQFADAAGRLQVSIGNVLMPTLAGLATAFRPLLESASKWLETNREVVGVQIAEWVVRAGTAMLSVLVPATQIAATVWGGLKMAFYGVEVAVNSMLEALLSGVARALLNFAKLEGALGNKELALSLAQTALAAHNLSKEFETSGDVAAASLLEAERNMKDLRGDIGKVGEEAKRVLSTVLPAAAKAAAAGIKVARDAAKADAPGMAKNDAMNDDAVALYYQERNRLEDEFQKNMREADAAKAAANLRDIEEIERKRKEAVAKRAQEEERVTAQALQRQQAGQQAVAGALMGTVGAARAAIAAGRNAGEAAVAVLESIANSLINSIVESLAKLAAKSLVSNIPILGPLFGGFLGMARGGLVPETIGIPGQDSVPALLMPGELVVPRDQVRAARTSGAGLAAGGGGGGGGITIHVDARSTVPDSRADLDRRMRPVAVAARRVERATGSR